MWPPLDIYSPRVAVATSLIVLTNMLAISGGIGGGGFFVPVALVVLQLNMSHASPLSNSLIFIANLIVLFGNLPYFDIRAGALLIPPMIVGTSIGVFINLAFPSWIILLCLEVLLLFLTWNTWNKASEISKSERNAEIRNEINRAVRESFNRPSTEGTSTSTYSHHIARRMSTTYNQMLGGAPVNFAAFEDLDASHLLERDEAEEDIGEWQEEDAKGPSNAYYIFPLVLTWFVLLGVDLGRMHVPACSPLYWTLTVIPVITALVSTILVARHFRQVVNDGTSDLVNTWEEESPGFVWNFERLWRYPIYTLLTGILSSALGIGGGLILGPLLLNLSSKPDPLRTTSLSSFAVLFSSSAVTMQYLAMKRLDAKYVAWFGSFVLVSAVIGQVLTQSFIRRSGRKSLIVYCLAFGTGIATILTLIELMESIMHVVHHPERTWHFHWRRICET
jgi:uncharacterized membrane protein YfcA